MSKTTTTTQIEKDLEAMAWEQSKRVKRDQFVREMPVVFVAP
jgi:hypothetical protein